VSFLDATVSNGSVCFLCLQQGLEPRHHDSSLRQSILLLGNVYTLVSFLIFVVSCPPALDNFWYIWVCWIPNFHIWSHLIMHRTNELYQTVGLTNYWANGLWLVLPLWVRYRTLVRCIIKCNPFTVFRLFFNFILSVFYSFIVVSFYCIISVQCTA